MKENYRLINALREKKPLVHHITNYVTVNDCANITLAIGASPIMADAVEEVRDMAAISQALVLNIGTLNTRTVEAMILAGKAANACGIPVVFDPVGVGASKMRNDSAGRILENITLAVLRGNISEIRFIAGLEAAGKGVDASENDMRYAENAGGMAKSLAEKLKCVVAVTGAKDMVSDGETVIEVENGHAMMSFITGTGCMCSSLIGAFCGAAPETPLYATAAALACMGVAGEMAYGKAGAKGNASFRIALHNAISRMDDDILSERAKLNEHR